MFRVVTNLAVDLLRQRQRQRGRYPGPWLPEPLPTQSTDAEALAEFADELSLGFVLMLERLSPAERVVFLLRDGFDYAFAEIGELIGVSAAACRQRYRRARSNLNNAKRFATPPDEQRALLDRLLLAVAEEDLAALVRMFSEDSVVLTDGGGIVSAAVRPVIGRERIAGVLLHLSRKAFAEGDMSYEFIELNGGVGLLLRQHGHLHSCFQVEGTGGVVKRLFVSRNPEKLAHLRPASG